MKTAYILHGCTDAEEYFSPDVPSLSNAHWQPWLQNQLLINGFQNVQTPEMPNLHQPNYSVWKTIFEFFPVTAETILVGHSAGCGFFLKWLSENYAHISKLVLVAPWLDPNRTRGDFLNCTINPNLSERVGEIHVLYSDDETVTGVKETVDQICATYPKVQLHRFITHGHFCLDEMKTEKFPELLKIILG